MIYSVELKVLIDGFGVTLFKELRTRRGNLESEIEEWIFRNRMEFGYREMIILSITVNGNEDITSNFR